MYKKTKPVHYVSGPELYRKLVEWYKTDDELPIDIYNATAQICDRLAMRHNFRGYSYIDEMKDRAKEKCLIALMKRKFNPEKSTNPFAYFSRIAYNEFVGVINEERDQTLSKHIAYLDYQFHSMLNGEDVTFVDVDDTGRLDELLKQRTKKLNKRRGKESNG